MEAPITSPISGQDNDPLLPIHQAPPTQIVLQNHIKRQISNDKITAFAIGFLCLNVWFIGGFIACVWSLLRDKEPDDPLRTSSEKFYAVFATAVVNGVLAIMCQLSTCFMGYTFYKERKAERLARRLP